MKTFEERKQDLIESYSIKYTNDNNNWWKHRPITYQTTKDLVPNVDEYVQTKESFFVRKNFHMRLLGLVFLVIFGMIFLMSTFKEFSIVFNIIFVIVYAILTILAIIELKDKSYKVILTKDIFWFEKMQTQISWKNLVCSYVKTDNRGEDVTTYILLHYYNEVNDTFEQFEYMMTTLEMDIEDICFHIEKFKESANLLHN